MQPVITRASARALQLAEQGAIYTPRNGAACPVCGTRLHVRRTFAWSGNTRLRYQVCINPQCLLAILRKMIKTVEEIDI